MGKMLANKVVKLNEYLYEEIKAFFNELEVGSQGTRVMYEKDIRQFFKVYRNKELEHLTEEDLQIKKRDMIGYRKYLQDNFELANVTINGKLTAVKRLYQYLSDEYDVNMAAFNFKRLKDQENPYAKLSQTEAERFAEVAYETEREKQWLKRCMILFAIRSSFRLREILNLKWNDFEEEDSYVKVTTVGKGQKKNTTSISKKLYSQIYDLKEMNKSNNWKDPEIVFQISDKAVNQMMSRLREKMNIPKERNLTFHSFRSVAIDYILDTTNGNITEAAIHANHSSTATTFKHYVNKTKDYSQTAGVRMDEEFDLDFIDKLTLENFKEFIQQGDFKLQLELKKYYEGKVK